MSNCKTLLHQDMTTFNLDVAQVILSFFLTFSTSILAEPIVMFYGDTSRGQKLQFWAFFLCVQKEKTFEKDIQ
jgi:hypothetical protein